MSIIFNDNLNVGGKSNKTPGVGEIELIVSILESGMFQNLRELDMKIIDSTGEEFAFARQGENQAQRVLAIFDNLMPKMSSQFRRLQIYLEDVLFDTARKMTEIRNKNLAREKRNIEAPEIHDKNRFWRPVLDLSRQCSGYWIAQDNWSSQCFSRITRASAGSASQGLRRIVKF